MNKMLLLFNEDILNEYDLKPLYFKVRCKKCNKSWGITLDERVITSRDLTCTDCLLDKTLSKEEE